MSKAKYNREAQWPYLHLCSQEDGPHADEDTLKLLEYTSICLQREKQNYQQASWKTSAKRRMFGLQLVSHKLSLITTFINEQRWACLWQRSSIIPSTWNEWKYRRRLSNYSRLLITKYSNTEHSRYRYAIFEGLHSHLFTFPVIFTWIIDV